MRNQTSMVFPPSLRINGDQFFDAAETLRKYAADALRTAAIYEQLAIEAWAKAESVNNSGPDPYLQTR